MRRAMIMGWLLSLLGCSDDGTRTTVIEDFDKERYMGTWQEIARIDNRFQKGLIDVSAEYRIKDNGDIEVINRGYSPSKEKWSEARATATTTDTPNHIRVSFFPLIKGDYWVLYVDENYQRAVVSGGKEGYLWIVVRSLDTPHYQIRELIDIASSFGFDTSKLLFSSSKMEQPYLLLSSRE